MGCAGVFFRDEVLGAGDKVSKSGHLVFHFPGLIPGATVFAAAADLRDRKTHPPVEQTENIAVERRIARHAVGPVAVEEDAAAAVAGMIAREEEPDRKSCAVGSGRKSTRDEILLRIVSGRRCLLFQHAGLSAREIDLGDGVGTQQSLVADSQGRRFILRRRFAAEGSPFAGRGNPSGRGGVRIKDEKAGHAVLARAEDDVSGKGVDPLIGDFFIAGEHFHPRLAADFVKRRAEDASIDGSFVGDDEPVPLAIGERIALAVAAGQENLRPCRCAGEGEDRSLGGVLRG